MRKKASLIASIIFFLIFLGSFFVHPRLVHSDYPHLSQKLESLPIIFVGPSLNRILSDTPAINSWEYKVSLLANVNVTTQEKNTTIGFKVDGLTEISRYTRDGVYSGVSIDTSGPIIYVRNQFDKRNAPFIAKLASELVNLLPIDDLEIQNGSLIVKTNTGIKAIYPFDGDIDSILGKTVVVFSQLNGSLEKFMIKDSQGHMQKPNYIDFRFKSPILRVEKEM